MGTLICDAAFFSFSFSFLSSSLLLFLNQEQLDSSVFLAAPSRSYEYPLIFSSFSIYNPYVIPTVSSLTTSISSVLPLSPSTLGSVLLVPVRQSFSSLHKGAEFKMLVFHPEHFYVRAFAQALSAWGAFG